MVVMLIPEQRTEFDFTEWPDEVLECRLDVLMDLDESVKHGRARAAELCREIAHLCFELDFRYNHD